MSEDNKLPEVVWKTLVQAGEEYSRYLVSNYGIVWDTQNDVEVSQVITGEPQYKYVNLVKDCGKRVLRRVNNIVSWTFHGEPPTPKHTSDHIDRDKFNNVEWNLRWADKRKQMQNRDNVHTLSCGTPVVEYIRKLGYDISEGGGLGQYLVNRVRQGDTLTEAYFNWSNLINPYPMKWQERSLDKGVEYEGIWYPTLVVFLLEHGNCSKDVYLQRLKEGMSVEEALTYKFDQAEKYRFEMDGFFMTTVEHCERLCVSYQRVTEYQRKRNLTFEEAVKIPVERVIKHNINGETKRNTEWYKQFNIPAKNANSWLVRKNKDGSDNGRTFRDVLEKYGVDTSGMEIYPCDGDVVMKNKPL